MQITILVSRTTRYPGYHLPSDLSVAFWCFGIWSAVSVMISFTVSGEFS